MSFERAGDAHFMARALELAQQAWGQTHPNPMVGAVVVEAGSIVAEGWHAVCGQDHAEIVALKALGRKPAVGAALYVTLEPCSTHGRTGACTDAIIQAGFQRVVVGALDPNPAHAGRGLTVLREAGIEVVSGVLAEECSDLGLLFNHWIVHSTPFIALKMALTLDGKFAAASGQSKWVTGPAAREDVMRWRRYFPAIAVGGQTVAQDDPQLTARFGGEIECRRRLVFDRELNTLDLDFLPRLYRDEYAGRTTVICLESAPTKRIERAGELGLGLWSLPGQAGGFDWDAFRVRCVAEEIFGVLIETGPRLATALLEQGVADYCFVYQAAKFMSDAAVPGIGTMRHTKAMSEAIQLKQTRMATYGEDWLVRGFL